MAGERDTISPPGFLLAIGWRCIGTAREHLLIEHYPISGRGCGVLPKS